MCSLSAVLLSSLQLLFSLSALANVTRVPLRRTTGRFILPKFQVEGDNVVSETRLHNAYVQMMPTGESVFGKHQELVKQAGDMSMYGVKFPTKFERDGRKTSDVSVYYHLLYTTEISIGTPPQPFRAVVDITWADLFVPSWNCTFDSYEATYCLPHNMYSSVASSTYVADLAPARVGDYGLYAWGNLSQDLISVGNITVAEQTFEEALQWRPQYFIDWDEAYDSSLGFARFHPKDFYNTVNAPGPLANMVQQAALDRNVFALKHPRTDDELGELILGGVDEDFSGSLVALPLTNVSGGDDQGFNFYASCGWQVAASYFSLSSYHDQTPLEIALDGYIAVFSNAYDNVMFPQAIGVQVARYLKQEHYLQDFSCDDRASFPNFTVALGPKAHNIVLNPWHYMHEVIDPDERKRCILPFTAYPEQGEHPNWIMLGTAFMASLYSEFDLDNGTISLAIRDDY